MMLIGGDATRGPGLTAAARIVQATGARWLCETFPTCLERGAGIPAVERLAYFAEGAAAQLDGVKHLVLAGARSPVSFSPTRVCPVTWCRPVVRCTCLPNPVVRPTHWPRWPTR